MNDLENDNKAFGIAVRFAYGPKLAGQCSPNNCAPLFLDFIKNGNGLVEVKKELKEFITLYPYLKILDPENPFSTYAIETYIIGGDSKATFENLISFYKSKGYPQMALDLQISKFIESGLTFYPHHTFSLLWSQFSEGNLTENNMNAITGCLVRTGKINSIKDGKICIETFKVKLLGNQIIEEIVKEEIIQEADFLEESLEQNQSVLIHRGFVIAVLTQEQYKLAKEVTKAIIQDFNKTLLK